MDILTIIVIGLMNIISCYLGAYIGQRVVKGMSIEMPSLNPIKTSREREEKKQAEIEQNKLDTIIRNIEKYDGTGRGQEDV